MNICQNKPGIEFEFVSPVNILSENSDCDTLSVICSFMLSLDYENYDGVILTHGSDTLSFTSSILGMMLSWVKIPIVITAANYVLSSPKSNGKDNFTASLDFIKSFHEGHHSNAGVFVIWKNENEEVSVHISTRLNEADPYLDCFQSFGGVPFGYMKNGIFKRIESPLNPISTFPNPQTEFLRGKNIALKNDILLIRGYVGLDFDCIDLKGKSAVVFKLYHSATACMSGKSTSFSEFCKRCFKSGVDVYIYSAKQRGYIYRSAKDISQRVQPMYNINTSSAYTKLLIAYSLNIKEILNSTVFYENLPG